MYIPADPDEAYRFGVKLATEPILPANLADAYVNETFAERRKLLLTRTVTKYVAIFKGTEKPLFSESNLFDSKGESDKLFGHVANYLGAYPIEIETDI